METKICNRCQCEKSIDEFPFKNKERGIKHGSCLECWKDIRKKSYNKNKETTLIRNKKTEKRVVIGIVN